LKLWGFSFAVERLISSEKNLSERTLTNELFMVSKSHGLSRNPFDI